MQTQKNQCKTDTDMHFPMNEGEMVADVTFFTKLAGRWCVPTTKSGAVRMCQVVHSGLEMLPISKEENRLFPKGFPRMNPPLENASEKRGKKKPTVWPEDQLERMGKAVLLQEEVEDQTLMAMERTEEMDCEIKQQGEKSNESICEDDDSDNSLSSGSDSDSDSQQCDSDQSESESEIET